uniref:Mitochondrial DNA polymerase catalytic subunit n=1 Tax=Steinernema glaseri TaxID=37863 RepID=A0A1I8AUU5_9BILA
MMNHRCSNLSTKSAAKRSINSSKIAQKRSTAVSEYGFKPIPLIPERLHKHLFSSEYPSSSVVTEDFELLGSEQLELPDIEAVNGNLLQRMEVQCTGYIDEYVQALEQAAAFEELPAVPSKWNYDTGWTKYNADGTFEKIPYPDGQVLFFDVEVCMEDGLLPTLAVAVSKSTWYSWCSERLITGTDVPELARLHHLIPLEPEGGSSSKRVVIGHNVAFDRARVREQYYPQKTGTKFWDTMSMSIPMFGMADHQLALYEKKSDLTDEFEEGSGWVSSWKHRVSRNSLSAVHEKLCGGISDLNIDKTLRDTFIKGSIVDVRNNFQALVEYCASDVKATFEIYKAMLPDFKKRMPSPITWFGMFEMCSAYLPINKNWRDFYDHCEKLCDAKNNEAVRGVVKAYRGVLDDFKEDHLYRNDPWMWAADWNVSRSSVYPQWYQGLFNSKSTSEADLDEVIAKDVKAKSRDLARVFGLCYGPYPLFFKQEYGWGFLVPPVNADEVCKVENVQLYSRRKEYVSMPVRIIYNLILDNSNTCMDVKIPGGKPTSTVGPFEFHRLPHPGGIGKNVGNPFVKDYADLFRNKILWASRYEDEMLQLIEDQSSTRYWGNYRQRFKEQLTVWLDDEASRGAIAPTIIPAGTVTRRGVHKLFLTASNPKEGMIGTEIKSMIQCNDGLVFVGADVDSQEQWLAATLGDSATGQGKAGATPFANMLLVGNKSDNSDLHSVVAHQVGISRDNAKVLNYARLYGSGLQHAVDFLKKEGITPKKARELSERLFSTTKGEQLNYSELRLTTNKYFEAFLRDMSIDYTGDFIKLHEKYFLPDRPPIGRNVTSDFEDWIIEKIQSHRDYDAKDIIAHLYEEEKVKLYAGGFETDTFNYLEMMLRSKELRTPILGCRLSKSLEPLPSEVPDFEQFRNKYRRSIINWVVQSSAVDFLHMLLLTMHWLIEKYDIEARYSISIHDEVRYVVNEKDKYRCALALHLSNAYVRAAISQHLGIQELPMSVAFFGQVDIDTVLRKEVTIKVKNPDGHEIPEGKALTFAEVLKCTHGTLSRGAR